MRPFYFLGFFLILALSFPYKKFLKKVKLIRKVSLKITNPVIRAHRSIYWIQNYLIEIGRNYISSLQISLPGGGCMIRLDTINVVEARFIQAMHSALACKLVTELKVNYFQEIRELSEGTIFENILLFTLKADYPIPYELSSLIPGSYNEEFELFVGDILEQGTEDNIYESSAIEAFFMEKVFYGDAYKARCMTNALLAYKGLLTAKQYIKSAANFPYEQKQNPPKINDLINYINENLQRYESLKREEHIFKFNYVDSSITLSFVYYLLAYLVNIALIWDLNYHSPEMFAELESVHMDFIHSSIDFSSESLRHRKLIKAFEYGGYICPNSTGEMEIMPASLLYKVPRGTKCTKIANVVFYRAPIDKKAISRLSVFQPNYLFQSVSCAFVRQGGMENLLVYTCDIEVDENFIARMFISMNFQSANFSSHYNQALDVPKTK